jgi:hypothetical protein
VIQPAADSVSEWSWPCHSWGHPKARPGHASHTQQGVLASADPKKHPPGRGGSRLGYPAEHSRLGTGVAADAQADKAEETAEVFRGGA